MNEITGHYLILGELVDYITGKTIADTHDERYRQKIAHLLVDEKKFSKQEIVTNYEVTISAGDKRAVIRMDFLIMLSGKPAMLIRYAPGSLVTRRRAAIAASRILMPVRIPFVVVTNGESAEILSGKTGEILSEGLEAIFSRTELLSVLASEPDTPVSPEKIEMESRILYAFDVDDKCPCDDTTCLSTFERDQEKES